MTDLDNKESSEEVRFHLREITADLALMVEALANTSETDSAARLEKIMNDLLVGLEHDLDHHGLQLRMLLLSPSSWRLEPERAEEAGRRAPAADEQVEASRELLQHEYSVLKSRISSAYQRIQAAAQAADQQSPDLTAAIDGALTELETALDTVGRATARAGLLADLEDPMAAARRAEEEAWANPVREAEHPAARSLTACPMCGAPLGSDDRTFTGSFCENCGTRWNLPRGWLWLWLKSQQGP